LPDRPLQCQLGQKQTFVFQIFISALLPDGDTHLLANTNCDTLSFSGRLVY
jgi:hypothetical protein